MKNEKVSAIDKDIFYSHDTSIKQLRDVQIMKSKEINKLIEQEEFREFLLNNNAARDVVLSRKSFSKTPGVVGCYFNGKSYIVYSTDERAQPYKLKEFNAAGKAYAEIAWRNNLKYSHSSAEKLSYVERTNYALNALKYWGLMANRYDGSEDGEIAKKNSNILKRVVIEAINHIKVVTKRAAILQKKPHTKIDPVILKTISELELLSKELNVYERETPAAVFQELLF